jgi:hypothetical protein
MVVNAERDSLVSRRAREASLVRASPRPALTATSYGPIRCVPFDGGMTQSSFRQPMR